MSMLTHTGSHPVLGCVDTIGEALDEVAGVEPVRLSEPAHPELHPGPRPRADTTGVAAAA